MLAGAEITIANKATVLVRRVGNCLRGEGKKKPQGDWLSSRLKKQQQQPETVFNCSKFMYLCLSCHKSLELCYDMKYITDFQKIKLEMTNDPNNKNSVINVGIFQHNETDTLIVYVAIVFVYSNYSI